VTDNDQDNRMTSPHLLDAVVMPRPGEMWRLKSNGKRVAMVVAVTDETDPEYPGWIQGYVTLDAPWYKQGRGGKGLDTFLKQFRKA
jgi:hypothetical protein